MAGHCQPVGTVITVRETEGDRVYSREHPDVWFAKSDLDSLNYQRAVLEKDLERLNETKSLVQETLNWMKTDEIVDVNPRDFKVYLAAKFLSSGSMTPSQKVVAISKIMEDNKIDEVFQMPFSVGSLVKVIGNRSRHGRPLGSLFKVKHKDDYANNYFVFECGSHFQKEDLTLASISYKDINNKLHEIEKELAIVNDKLRILVKYDLQEGNQNTITVSQLVESIDNLSEKDRLLKVAQLFV